MVTIYEKLTSLKLSQSLGRVFQRFRITREVDTFDFKIKQRYVLSETSPKLPPNDYSIISMNMTSFRC